VLQLEIDLADEAATERLAQRLAACPELRSMCLELRGDLGAGKTTFVRHLLRALGVTGRIKSPTYALAETYDVAQAGGDPFQAWHFDFYRLQSPSEWESAGFRDVFAGEGLKLVEWPEKVADLIPNHSSVPVLATDVAIKIVVMNLGDDTRRVTLTAHSQLGEAVLGALA
jgi:tRNA threonylcarbamoyladenosine biosynthesis protein TsaE